MCSIFQSGPSFELNWLKPALTLVAGLGLLVTLKAQSSYLTPYSVTTLAGSTSSGSGDGAGNAAHFNGPAGVAVDGFGNIFVADSENQVVRQVTSSGVVTTLKAGINPTHFGKVGAIALDASGNIFVADYSVNVIWKISPSREVTVFAGAPVSHGGSNDGAGVTALFNVPLGLATDALGNVYVGDYLNHTIRKITIDGVVSTFAGTTGVQGSNDGVGSAAHFSYPRGLAIDRTGNVYVADTGNGTIRKITAAGVVSTVAGSAGNAGSVDGKGSFARFNNPMGVAIDGAGNVYVADAVNNLIRKIAPDGSVSTLAGSTVGSSDGSGLAAHFNTPVAVAVDQAGTLFIADSANHMIRQSMPITPVIVSQPKSLRVATTYSATFTVVAGGAPALSYQWRKNGIDLSGARESSFSIPSAVEADAGEYTVVATNSQGAAVSSTVTLMVEPALNISTYAGNPSNSGSVDGLRSAARFDSPYGIAVDSGGNLYTSDTTRGTIRKISPDGLVTTLAGLADAPGSTDGAGSQARFGAPYGVAVDRFATVYVADTGNNTVREITTDGLVTTLAGTVGVWGSADGTGTAASFSQPWDVAVDSSGNVYVADEITCTIRKISPAGVVTTFAGLSGAQGNADGQGSAARFNTPMALALDPAGIFGFQIRAMTSSER